MKKLLWIALWVLPTVAQALPDHAHYHYMIGIRAFHGQKNANILTYEASKEGLRWDLASVNAGEIQRMAAEIAGWVKTLEEVQSGLEADLIAPEVKSMRLTAAKLVSDADELRTWIDERGDNPKPELRLRVKARSLDLYHQFGQILKHHKAAEARLEILPPPTPSRRAAPDEG